mmetsp:Transcript_14327/g.21041  ORF Transcript_14327/g.21041 Transcript_14327/m.21041 type:complete len:88 (-) Transcript_14327:38-301(-)
MSQTNQIVKVFYAVHHKLKEIKLFDSGNGDDAESKNIIRRYHNTAEEHEGLYNRALKPSFPSANLVVHDWFILSVTPRSENLRTLHA